MGRKNITDIEERIKQLKAQKQTLLNSEKKRERKERTKRLIEIGAVIETNLKINTPGEAKALTDYLTKFPENYEKIMNYVRKHGQQSVENIEVNDSAQINPTLAE